MRTDTMPRFVMDGMRSVTAPSASDAARIFAGRMARKEYGRRGYVRSMRLNSWAENGQSHTFEAFIGRDVGNACSGRNEWVYVSRVGD